MIKTTFGKNIAYIMFHHEKKEKKEKEKEEEKKEKEKEEEEKKKTEEEERKKEEEKNKKEEEERKKEEEKIKKEEERREKEEEERRQKEEEERRKEKEEEKRKKKKKKKKRQKEEERRKKKEEVHKKADEIKSKGNEEFKKRNYDEAIKLYQQAIFIYPKEMVYYLNSAKCYLEKKEYDKAIELCKYVCENTHDFSRRATSFGIIEYAYREQNKLDEALKAFEDSQKEKNDPRIKEAYKEIKKLKEKYDAEAYINPEMAEKENLKANELYRAKKFPEAIKLYEEAIKRNPKLPKYYTNMLNPIPININK